MPDIAPTLEESKSSVKDFWEVAACGETLYLPDQTLEGYLSQSARRYELEPYISQFANFRATKHLRVLEIGVGLGADHQCFAEHGARLTGVDLTQRAIEHVRRRLSLFGLSSDLRVADAESLPFEDASFDVVYSWGVIHHTPDTGRAIQEIFRVLTKGGTARVMIYSKWSLVGLMLWVRYAPLSGRPFTSLRSIYAKHLESPGTKAYTHKEARHLFSQFSNIDISTVLTHADLLESDVGQKHQGLALNLARQFWPRRLLRHLGTHLGLFMLIVASKS